ncbi:MAG: glycosyltransferase 87 family protein, partial [Desulfurococcaceae archaeon]
IYTGKATEKVAYPPLAVFIFVAFHYIATSVSNNVTVWRIIDKIPLLISFNVVYLILRKKYKDKAGDLWLLNCMAYVIIAGYQFDLIVAMLLTIAYIYLLKERFELYGILIVLAALIKQAVVILFLIPIVVMIKRKDLSRLLKYLGISATVTLSISMPFLLVDPLSFINKIALFHATRIPQNFSIWAIPIYIAWYDISVIPGWIAWAWIIPFSIYFITWIISYYREKIYNEDIHLAYIILILIGFLLLSKIGNNNYFMWISPFIPILFHKLRHKSTNFVSFYILVTLILGFLHGFFTLWAAAVAGYSVFLFEDLNWVSAEQVIIYSVGENSLYYQLLLQFRSSPSLREIFAIFDSAKPVSMIIFTLIYVIYLIYLALYTVKHLKPKYTFSTMFLKVLRNF